MMLQIEHHLRARNKLINELNRFNTCKHDYRHPILVLGTKSDLMKDRKVSFDEAFQFANQNGLIFREINSLHLMVHLIVVLQNYYKQYIQ